MRLVLIRKRYSAFGGAERFIERLMPRLLEGGIDIRIISEAWSDPEGRFKITKIKSSGLTRAARFRSFQKAAKSAIDQILADSGQSVVVQSHERFIGADIARLGDGVHLAWISRLQRKAGGFRSLALKLDPYHRAIIATEKKMAADSRLQFVVNSQLVQRELQSHLNVPPHRITYIPNGVETAYFSVPTPEEKAQARKELAANFNLDLHSCELIVTVIGSGFSRKGIFPLIQACARIKGCALIIAGKDKQIFQARNLAERLGASGRIALTGALSDIRPILQAADVFALPSLYDPSSNAVLEAMSSGLPVVVTHDVGMADEIALQNAGFISDRSPDGLEQNLGRFLDKTLLTSMSKNARSFALNLSQDQVINQWLQLYADTLAKRR